jgi:phosphatidylglycerol:prolipoprotein diacylglycerol transferase
MATGGVTIFAYYLHRLDPVIIRITDTIQLRWYGVAYVIGFIVGYLLLRRWARRGIGVLKEYQVADFLTYAALFGVLLGGRLGYMLLYDRENFAANPMTFFHVMDGGMASHGGIAGLVLFTLYWSLRHRQSWTGLGDNLVVAAPPGLFFGRMANFINGELYGRPAEVPWAMKFPEEFVRWPVDDGRHNAVVALLPELPEGLSAPDAVKALARTDDAFARGIEPYLTPRHPSQLYEAALEGVLLFAILFCIREKWPRAPHGMMTGLFFVLYAGFRIWGEAYREPEKYIAGLTEGQFYSCFMIVAGLAFLAFALFRRRTPPPLPPLPPQSDKA